jgi:hypothetical protein
MILIQIVARPDVNIERLLRDRVTHQAQTFYWGNKGKTRLRHTGHEGYIEIGTAEGVVVAVVNASGPEPPWGLTEKFIGRLTAWFRDELVAINIQFLSETGGRQRSRKR